MKTKRKEINKRLFIEGIINGEIDLTSSETDAGMVDDTCPTCGESGQDCVCAVEMVTYKQVDPSPRFKVNIHRADSIDGFGAYARGSIDNDDGGIILLNVEGLFNASIENNISARQLLVEILMHEVGHALDEWFEAWMPHEKIREITQEYIEKKKNEQKQKVKKEYAISLKFGRLKDVFSGTPEAKKLVDEYRLLECQPEELIDQEQLKNLLCKIIDEYEDGSIYLEFQGKFVSRQEAKNYLNECYK